MSRRRSLRLIILSLLLIVVTNQNICAVSCTGVPVWTAGGQPCNGMRQYGGRLYQNSCGNGWDGAGDNPSVNGDWTDLGACGNEPVVTTNGASAIGANSATLNGTVTSNSGFALTDRGFIFSANAADVDAATVGTPGSATVLSEGGTSVAAYNLSKSGLCRGVTYYYKSYATNSDGTGYGSRVSFTSTSALSISSTQDGAWTSTATWGGCTAPSTTSAIAGDNINIYHDVTVASLSVSNNNVITVKSGGVLTISGAIDMGWTSSIVVEAGGILIVNSVDYSSGSSSITNSGTFTVNDFLTLDVTGTFNSTGTFSVANNVTLSSNGDVSLSGTNTIGGSVSATGAGTNFDVNGGTLDVTGGMSLDGDATHSMDGAVTVGGDWTITGTATASVGGSVDVTGTMHVLSDGVVSGSGVITWGTSNTNPSCSAARVVCQDGTQLDDLPELPCGQTKGDLPATGIDLAACAAPAGLPVELLYFKAIRNGEQVDISWSTAMEYNNHFFMIEKSMDGKAWGEIIYVPGAGFSEVVRNYALTDYESGNKGSYYRLKQTDFDGTSEYSKVVYLPPFEKEKDFTLNPNPVKETFVISFTSGHSVEFVELFNQEGETMLKENRIFGNDLKFDTSNFKAGVYFVKVRYSDEVITKRLIKQ